MIDSATIQPLGRPPEPTIFLRFEWWMVYGRLDLTTRVSAENIASTPELDDDDDALTCPFVCRVACVSQDPVSHDIAGRAARPILVRRYECRTPR